jgi:hypothetical protein
MFPANTCPKLFRLCLLMCGRPLAFRQVRHFDFFGYAEIYWGEAPDSLRSGTEAQSASAHQAA